MRTRLFFRCAAGVVLLALTAFRGKADDLRVSAAASLTDALKEIDAAFEKETGAKVQLNLGASSTLARQIEEGAPVDVFFSADLAKMEGLEKKGLIETATKTEMLSNALVVVVPADRAVKMTSMKDLAASSVKRITTGDPKAVPVGVYAKEYLQKAGIWGDVEKKIVATENVRAALAAVEAGNADAGIVYKTDAAVSSKVKVAYELPAAEGPKIVYPVAEVKNAKNATMAHKYLAFLGSPASGRTFKKFGFIVLPKADGPAPSISGDGAKKGEK